MFDYHKDRSGEVYATLDPIKDLERREKLYRIYLEKSYIPQEYWGIEFEDYAGNKNSEQFKKVKYYAENCHTPKFKGASLYIHGNHSTQKTACACNILKESLRKKRTAKFILAGELISALYQLQGFSKNDQLYNYIADIKNCDILLIDDCWDPDKSLMWKNSDNKNMIIAEWDIFLRSLISKEVQIIMTSNFDKSIISQYYGKSLFELIDRNFVSIEFTDSVKEIKKLEIESIFDDLKF